MIKWCKDAAPYFFHNVRSENERDEECETLGKGRDATFTILLFIFLLSLANDDVFSANFNERESGNDDSRHTDMITDDK